MLTTVNYCFINNEKQVLFNCFCFQKYQSVFLLLVKSKISTFIKQQNALALLLLLTFILM